MKVYIKEKRCLGIFGQKADSSFWDEHWEISNLRNYITSCRNNDFIMGPLKTYLPDEDGIILEGGCGRAQNVFCMRHNGYKAIGVDFAEATVKAVKEALPELDIRKSDVGNLPFKDGEIAGYWSLGVIEHFWEGYDSILDEMARVIRNKRGFLFLTFPHMSLLRKIKGSLGFYKKRYAENDVQRFYQYCLDYRKVIEDLEKRGFILREKSFHDGIKGFKDEISLVKPLLQQVYDGKKLNGRIGRRVKRVLDKCLAIFASHIILLVMEKVVINGDEVKKGTF